MQSIPWPVLPSAVDVVILEVVGSSNLWKDLRSTDISVKGDDTIVLYWSNQERVAIRISTCTQSSRGS